MFGALFRKDVLLHLLSSRFLVSILTGALLLAGSSWILLREQGDDVRSYQAFQAAHARQIGSYETGAESRLDALAMGGRIVDRRPPELSFLLSGVHRELPKSFWISAFDGPVPEGNLVGNRVRELFELVDFRFVVGVIFSLLALILSYDAINGEKQAGTLRLTLANPVSIRTMLLAKWASLNTVLALAFLLAFLASIALALVSPTVTISAAGAVRLLLIAVVSLLYLSVFVALGLLVSALFREPYPAAASALLLWVLLVFVVPGAATSLGALRGAGPDYAGTAAARQDDLGYNYRQVRQQYLDQGMDWQAASAATQKFWTEVVEPKRAANLTRSNERFLNRKGEVVERGRDLARLSPYGAFSFAVTELAGAGVAEQLRFETAVERYRRTFQEFIRTQQQLGRWNEVTVAEVPPFRFEATNLRLGETTLVDAAVLAAFALLLFGAAFLRMQRYDLR
ncbi:MAG TPA: ABC transporter permease subunit [Thermoanaerobaculia bacterium]|nr:ABC transporter permease subunit [Thermoanaerobaculia bacterium]